MTSVGADSANKMTGVNSSSSERRSNENGDGGSSSNSAASVIRTTAPPPAPPPPLPLPPPRLAPPNTLQSPSVFFAMDPIQEAEFNLSISHYFLWKKWQEKAKQQGPTTVNTSTTTTSITDATDESSALGKENDTVSTSTDQIMPTVKADNPNFHLLSKAMLEQFPSHAVRFQSGDSSSNNLEKCTPPMIKTLYYDFPALQHEVYAARAHIAALEGALDQARQQLYHCQQQCHELLLGNNNNNKRKEPPSTTPSGFAGGGAARKRYRPAPLVGMRLSARPDVPDDIKELISQLKTKANREKAGDKKQIAALEAKLKKASEEKNQQQAAAALVPPAPPPKAKAAKPAPRKKPPPENTTKNPGPYKEKATWSERIAELEHFRKGYGHCKVPRKVQGLGDWVYFVRLAYKQIQENHNGVVPPNNTGAAISDDQCYALSEERIALLNSMGFAWSALATKAVKWQVRFNELVEYNARFGNCNVPRSYKENPTLGGWVHSMRREYRQKKLSDTKVQMLEDIGFQWVTRRPVPSFEDRLEECREFRRKHGHLAVETADSVMTAEKEESDDDELLRERSFRNWAQRKRDEYRRIQNGFKVHEQSLTKTRIRKLDELGFHWTVSSSSRQRAPRDMSSFDEKLAKLRAVKEKYGDCNDVSNLKAAGYSIESSLYSWVKTQRKEWKKIKNGESSALTADRIAKLEALDFDFEPRSHYNYSARDSKQQKAAEAAPAIDDAKDDSSDSVEGEEEPARPGYERYRI